MNAEQIAALIAALTNAPAAPTPTPAPIPTRTGAPEDATDAQMHAARIALAKELTDAANQAGFTSDKAVVKYAHVALDILTGCEDLIKKAEAIEAEVYARAHEDKHAAFVLRSILAHRETVTKQEARTQAKAQEQAQKKATEAQQALDALLANVPEAQRKVIAAALASANANPIPQPPADGMNAADKKRNAARRTRQLATKA